MYFSNGLTYLLKQLPHLNLTSLDFNHLCYNTDMLFKWFKTYYFWISAHMTSAILFSSYRIMRLWREDRKPVKQFIK